MQADGERRNLKLGSEILEMSRVKPFSEYISNLIMNRNIGNCQIFGQNFFLNKVMIDFNMLSLTMKNRVRSQQKCRNIITLDARTSGEENMEITKKHSKPRDLSRGMS